QLFGADKTNEKVVAGLIDSASLAAVAIGYLILHVLVSSPIQAYKNYKKLGFWDGNTFHYYDEVLVYTGVIHPKGQNLVNITFPRECKNALVSTKTTINGAHERVKAGFTIMQQKEGVWLIPMQNGISSTSIRLSKREQVLVTESVSGTIPTRVKVLLESWEL
ncbi:hypothetical protein LRP50_15945, partial [Enterovibrio sp. ZSDZ42]